MIDEAMSHTWVKELPRLDGLVVEGTYLVKESSKGTTRNGDPYLAITLSDKTGDVDAKFWGCRQDQYPFVAKDKVVRVKAEVLKYKERPQLKVIEASKPDFVDVNLFLDSSPKDAKEMLGELKEALREVQSVPLRSLSETFFEHQELLSQFIEAPAAKGLHHNYLGGLLEHTLSVVNMANLLSRHYTFLDRDLLLVAALLHDVGKVRELKWRPYSIDYTDEGRLIGHIVLGIQILEDLLAKIQDFPETLHTTLQHIILSHHGQLEFGSPKRPKTLEAVALNLIDDLDAKLNGIKSFIEGDTTEGHWTEYNRLLSRFFLKGPLGRGDVLKEMIP